MVFQNTISASEEMLAYETLWAMQGETLKSIAQMFKENSVPPSKILEMKSDLFSVDELKKDVKKFIDKKTGFSICLNGTFQYPQKLREARYPLELFYYKGSIDFLEYPCVSVVGSRKCSDEGLINTKQLVMNLAEAGYAIVSGLALGVDTAALATAIASKGKVIGVIGTPIDQYYPKENKGLQDQIAEKHLLISQVPFYRYEKEPFKNKRLYFPQRNETMSALSSATIIVEASDTSGTLTQARAALSQGRKLFILNSCFENKNISWPHHFEEKGAIRVRSLMDIFDNV